MDSSFRKTVSETSASWPKARASRNLWGAILFPIKRVTRVCHGREQRQRSALAKGSTSIGDPSDYIREVKGHASDVVADPYAGGILPPHNAGRNSAIPAQRAAGHQRPGASFRGPVLEIYEILGLQTEHMGLGVFTSECAFPR